MNRDRKAAVRGWSNVGVIANETPWTLSTALPPRQNAHWNDTEDYDLCQSYTAGVGVEKLAARHMRSRGAIEARIERCLDGAERYMESLQ